MNHKLFYADAWEWISQQPDKSVDHIITDMVYGMDFYLEECIRICKGNIITFCSSEDYPFRPTEKAYWIKTPSTKNYIKKLGRFVEQIFIYRQGETFNCIHWSQMTGVYDDRIIHKGTHPWRKPLSLIERLFRIYTNEGDTVLDQFVGSGTAFEAGTNLNRSVIGIDNDIEWINCCRNNHEVTF